jgi:hypothetical protein
MNCFPIQLVINSGSYHQNNLLKATSVDRYSPTLYPVNNSDLSNNNTGKGKTWTKISPEKRLIKKESASIPLSVASKDV